MVNAPPRIYIPHHPSFRELADFLGPDFDRSMCNCFDEKGAVEAKAYATPEEFIRNTMLFAYQSIGLATQGIHRPYHSVVLLATADMPAPTLIDVGAGSGEDALLFHHAGFMVSVADIYGRTFSFLDWRMRRHGIDKIYVWDSPVGEKIPEHDVAICYDVLEHLNPEQQRKLIDALCLVGKSVFVNLIRADESMDGLHFPVDFEDLTNYVVEKYPDKVWYKDFYPDEKGFRQRLLAFGENVTCEKLPSA